MTSGWPATSACKAVGLQHVTVRTERADPVLGWRVTCWGCSAGGRSAPFLLGVLDPTAGWLEGARPWCAGGARPHCWLESFTVTQ